jgi:hypothetical protein
VAPSVHFLVRQAAREKLAAARTLSDESKRDIVRWRSSICDAPRSCRAVRHRDWLELPFREPTSSHLPA